MPANGRAEYPLTYRPLTMSRAGALHEGSAFFPIPDGSGLLYRLVGAVRARAIAGGRLPAGSQPLYNHTHTSEGGPLL